LYNTIEMNVYVLRCSDNKYYVGKTQNINSRIIDHFTNCGSAWTKKYKPLEVVETIKNCNKFDEDKYVLMYMDKYGIENVRGGIYSLVKLTNEQLTSIKTQLTGANDLCFKCQQPDHFAKECKSSEYDNEDNEDNFEIVVQCYRCNKIGHYANQCYVNIKNDNTEDEKIVQCYKCNRIGHYANQCYARTKLTDQKRQITKSKERTADANKELSLARRFINNMIHWWK
jgi:hypothetical protein